jgi:Methyltransferase domain
MSRAEFCTANRRNWDERVAIHRRDATGFYAIERFLAGEKRLHAIESGELGEVSRKRLIHLQCHFGLDTLILAREGAIATGLDFSPAAIAEARRLATEIGIAADFVCADVYDARQAVEGEFDIAFTTWGTICWLPDIEARTYTGDPTALTAARTYQWMHSLPRILDALTGAGLVLDFMHEHNWLPWPPFPMCARHDNSTYCPPKDAPQMPLAVSLRAIKAPTRLSGVLSA